MVLTNHMLKREWESRNFETGRKKRPFYRKVGQYLSDPTLVLIFGLAFMESAKSFETFFPASIFLFDNWPKTIHKLLALTLFFQGQTAALPCRVQAVPPPTLRYRIKKNISHFRIAKTAQGLTRFLPRISTSEETFQSY